MTTPINISPEEHGRERREFLRVCTNLLAGITIVGIAAPIFTGCEPSNVPTATGTPPPPGNDNNGSTGTAFDVSSLTGDGQGLVTQTKGPDGYRIVIVRLSADQYTALSMRCTHEGCSVNPPSGGQITCSCHGSQFELNGAVKRGPATQPLKTYQTTYDAAAGQARVLIV
jgi:Rieske Fe-S protein